MANQFKQFARVCVLSLLVGGTLVTSPARADEQGSGHYLNGFFSYMAGILPPEPGFYFKNVNYFYEGGAAKGLTLPVGGRLVADFQSFQFLPMGVFMYEPKGKVLGAKFATTVAIPGLYQGNEATVGGPINRVVRREVFGMSDVILVPGQLGWTAGNNNYVLGATIFAPTGYFQRFNITPLGKNFWTFEPGLGYTYFDQKTGWEISGYAAVDFNTKNNLTNYQSGVDSHLDWVIAKHFPVVAMTPPQAKAAQAAGKAAAEAAAKAAVEQALKAAGVTPPQAPGQPSAPAHDAPPAMPKPFLVDIAPGLGGFIYQQVTDDTGPLATLLKGFRGRTIGLGPQIQATTNIGEHQVTWEFKMYKEFAVQNRLQGMVVWINGATKL